jgi:seryl-tRNA synthetase
MTWIRKNYKLTLAVLTMLAAFFTWSAKNGGLFVSLSHAQVARIEAKIKATDKKTEANRDKVQQLAVKQAKDTAEIKADLKAVKKELEEQRTDTRLVREDTQEVLRLLVQIQSRL